jgi:acyl-CoA synthetase (NDP forming)
VAERGRTGAGPPPGGAGRAGRFADVSRLLQPRAVAVVGASDQPGNLGGTAVRYLRKFGYPGPIWPVNPRRPEVAGLPCFPRLADLPGRADLAILAVSAEAIEGLVRECGAAGIPHGIVWAGGFAEVGGDGPARQEALVEACRETGVTVCGPNCIGVINTHLGLTASFASSLLDTDALLRGNISMISQSGGMATVTQALAWRAGFGFRHVISAGNEAVLTTADFIHALAVDPETRVILAYLEGVADGDLLLAALAEARAAGKPVVVLKGGATAASARAVVAHTGALAGEDRVWDAVLREQAVIRVHSQEELLDVAMFLGGTGPDRLPAGPGVAALTFGGGMGVLAADQCAREGLATPSLAPASRERLAPRVTPLASIANPFDLTPETYNQPRWLAEFPGALDVIAADPLVDTLLFQLGATAHRAKELMDEISALRARTAKTVAVAWALAPESVLARFPGEGIYPFPETARAVRALAHAVRYRQARERTDRPADLALPAFDWGAFVARPTAGTVISEHDCHALLGAAGLPTAAGRLARDADQAVEAAREVGWPVAMKGISGAVTHRAAAGLLALGLRSKAEVRAAAERLLARARELGVRLDGLYVQHMVAGELELLVSAFRDPVFGVMVSLGIGGNLTEAIDDVTLERAPVDEAGGLAMLDRLRLLRRARPPEPHRQAAAGFVAGLSRLAASAPWRRFVLEVNPIKVGREGAVAVDGLLVVEEP